MDVLKKILAEEDMELDLERIEQEERREAQRKRPGTGDEGVGFKVVEEEGMKEVLRKGLKELEPSSYSSSSPLEQRCTFLL